MALSSIRLVSVTLLPLLNYVDPLFMNAPAVPKNATSTFYHIVILHTTVLCMLLLSGYHSMYRRTAVCWLSYIIHSSPLLVYIHCTVCQTCIHRFPGLLVAVETSCEHRHRHIIISVSGHLIHGRPIFTLLFYVFVCSPAKDLIFLRSYYCWWLQF